MIFPIFQLSKIIKKHYMWNLSLKFLQVQGLVFLSMCAKNQDKIPIIASKEGIMFSQEINVQDLFLSVIFFWGWGRAGSAQRSYLALATVCLPSTIIAFKGSPWHAMASVTHPQVMTSPRQCVYVHATRGYQYANLGMYSKF